MINLTVEKIVENSGSTKFKLTPASFTVGGVDANSVDKISISLPEEWQDKTVRVYFVPANSTPFYILYDGTPFDVSANMTKAAGAIVVDAIGGDYHAFTTNANYRAYTHLTATGEEEPTYTPSQIEQFLAQAQSYSYVARTAKDLAVTASENAEEARAETVRIKEEVISAGVIAQQSAAEAQQYAQSAEGYKDETARLKQEAEQSFTGLIDEYNHNAEVKTNEFNAYVTSQEAVIDSFVEGKTAGIDDIFNTKVSEGTARLVTETDTQIARIDASVQDIREEISGYVDEAQTARQTAVANAEQTASDVQAVSGIKSEVEQAVSQGITDITSKASALKSEFDTNAQQKTSAFDGNATSKTNTFNSNATNKTSTFNSNATAKTNDFNTNYNTKLTEASQRLTDEADTQVRRVIEAVAGVTEEAEQARDDAQAARTQASEYATSASTSASNASRYSGLSRTSAEEARTSRNTARQQRQSATQSATSAQTAKADAETARDEATGKVAEGFDQIVEISATQPTSPLNRFWIGNTQQRVELMTKQEVEGYVDKPTVKSTLDTILIPNTKYFLGTQTELALTLPTNAEVGQEITVSWYNGETPATLSIDGTMLRFDYVPSRNTRSEISCIWDGLYWSDLGIEQEVPNE